MNGEQGVWEDRGKRWNAGAAWALLGWGLVAGVIGAWLAGSLIDKQWSFQGAVLGLLGTCALGLLLAAGRRWILRTAASL